MGFRFYKSFKLFPGVRLNLSKSGVSASVGIPGATVNFSGKGARTTLGLPGTGLSFISQRRYSSGTAYRQTPSVPVEQYEFVPQSGGQAVDKPTPRQIQSQSIDELSSSGLEQLLASTKQLAIQRREISSHIQRLTDQLRAVVALKKKRKASLFRYFYRKSISILSRQAFDLSAELSDHKTWLSNSKIELQFSSNAMTKTNYGHVVRAFDKLCNCKSIWDVTADEAINKAQTRSAADKGLSRKRVSLSFSTTDFFTFPGKSMQFENANGEDIHILPEIIFMLRQDGEIALIEITEIDLNFSISNFIEQDEIPTDSEVVGKTWAKVNKNGKPDLRFSDNYEIPICRYGQILFKTKTGLLELYQFSNANAAEEYVLAMKNYTDSIKSSSHDYLEFDQ